MIAPSNRYSFNTQPRRPRKRLPVIVALVAGVAALTVAVWQRDSIVGWFSADDEHSKTLNELWETQQYDRVIERTSVILERDPLDATALMFDGFARFYLSTEAFTLEEKLPQVNEAIFKLRKGLLSDDAPFVAGIEYVLGKAYHYKGRYYLDLSIEYLNRALEHGHTATDIFDFLGVAYSRLGYYERSAESFVRAIEAEATDMRYLALSQAYINAGRLEDAEAYLLRTINKTSDPVVEQKSRFLLGKVYLDRGALPKAEDQYRSILDLNPRSADAYYYLGEIYLEYGKPIEARAQWREALIIDPSHYGARLRYYK